MLTVDRMGDAIMPTDRESICLYGALIHGALPVADMHILAK